MVVVRRSARSPRIEFRDGHYVFEVSRVASVTVGARCRPESRYIVTDSVVTFTNFGAFVDIGMDNTIIYSHGDTGTSNVSNGSTEPSGAIHHGDVKPANTILATGGAPATQNADPAGTGMFTTPDSQNDLLNSIADATVSSALDGSGDDVGYHSVNTRGLTHGSATVGNSGHIAIRVMDFGCTATVENSGPGVLTVSDVGTTVGNNVGVFRDNTLSVGCGTMVAAHTEDAGIVKVLNFGTFLPVRAVSTALAGNDNHVDVGHTVSVRWAHVCTLTVPTASTQLGGHVDHVDHGKTILTGRDAWAANFTARSSTAPGSTGNHYDGGGGTTVTVRHGHLVAGTIDGGVIVTAANVINTITVVHASSKLGDIVGDNAGDCVGHAIVEIDRQWTVGRAATIGIQEMLDVGDSFTVVSTGTSTISVSTVDVGLAAISDIAGESDHTKVDPWNHRDVGSRSHGTDFTAALNVVWPLDSTRSGTWETGTDDAKRRTRLARANRRFLKRAARITARGTLQHPSTMSDRPRGSLRPAPDASQRWRTQQTYFVRRSSAHPLVSDRQASFAGCDARLGAVESRVVPGTSLGNL